MKSDESKLIKEAKESLLFCYKLSSLDYFWYRDGAALTKHLEEYTIYFDNEVASITNKNNGKYIEIYLDNCDVDDVDHVKFDSSDFTQYANLRVKNTAGLSKVLYKIFLLDPELIYMCLKFKRLVLIGMQSELVQCDEEIKDLQQCIDANTKWKQFINSNIKECN